MEPLFIRVPDHGFGRKRLEQLENLNSVTMRLGAYWHAVFASFVTKKNAVRHIPDSAESISSSRGRAGLH